MVISRFLFAGLSLWLGIGLSASGYPIDDLSLYEKVYLEGMVTNSPVLIIDIDRAGNRVKVQEDDGFSKWVPAGRIMSKWENRTDAMKKVGGIGLIAYCVYKVPDCDSARLGSMLHQNEYVPGAPLPKVGGGFVPFVSSPRDSDPARQAKSGGVPDFMNPETFERIPGAAHDGASGQSASLPPSSDLAKLPDVPEVGTVEAAINAGMIRFHVENGCQEAVEIEYALQTPNFQRASPFVIALDPGERKGVKLGPHSEFDRASILYIHAKSQGHEWGGAELITIDGKAQKFMEPSYATLPNQIRLVRLTCE